MLTPTPHIMYKNTNSRLPIYLHTTRKTMNLLEANAGDDLHHRFLKPGPKKHERSI